MTNEIERFEIILKDEERAEKTVEKYVRDVRHFLNFAKGRKICKMLVLEYKSYLVENYRASSAGSMLSSVNAFLKRLELREFCVKAIKIQKSVFLSKGSELNIEEYKRLVAVAKDSGKHRLYLILQTLASTGIRISELRFITVESIKSEYARISMKGKLRTVFLPSMLCMALRDYVREKNIKSGPVFISKNGNPLDRSNICSEMKKLCTDANVPREKIHPHNLRHLFARTYYSVQKDIVRLADILGHSSVNTTRIYTMESGETHRRQIQELGLLDDALK